MVTYAFFFFPSVLGPGHKHLHDKQYGHQQTPGHHSPRRACQSVWLTHWQRRLQNQGNSRGQSHRTGREKAQVFDLAAIV